MVGMVWYGKVWYGMVWYGMVWSGMVWYAVWAVWALAVYITVHIREPYLYAAYRIPVCSMFDAKVCAVRDSQW